VRNNRILWVIVTLAILLRIAGAVYIGEGFLKGTDAGAYVGIARNLVAGNGFVTEEGDHRAWYAPFYPLVLAPLFGLIPFPFLATRILHALMSGVIVLIVYRLGDQVFKSRRAGLIGAALVAFDPFLIYFSLFLLTETMFIFWSMALLWWLMIKVPRQGTTVTFLLAGLILGLATLTRPVILGYFPLVVVGWIYYSRDRLQVAAGQMLLVALGCAVLMLPWIVRNYNVYGKFVPVTLQSGMALYAGNNPLNHRGGGLGEGVDYGAPPVPGFEDMDERAQSEALTRLALGYIMDHPGKFIRMIPVKLSRCWSLLPSSHSGHTQWYYAAVSLGSYGILLPFFLAGLWLTRSTLNRSWPFYGYLLFMLAFVAVYYGTIRFRVPLIPLISLWAAVGLDRTWSWLTARNDVLKKNEL